MKEEIQLLTEFVEGKMSSKEFEQQLYTNHSLELFLSKAEINWNGTYLEGTNAFLYLVEQNYSSTEGVLNAQGTAVLFLRKLEIETVPTINYTEHHKVSTLSPQYIDADSVFIEKHIMPTDKTLSKPALKQYIKARYTELFAYQSKPPKWIQNPQWPIKNDKPLFFLTQVDIKDCRFFHDNGCIYLFLDPETGAIETIQQFY